MTGFTKTCIFFEDIYFTDVYLQNATHYLKAFRKERYGTEFAEFLIAWQFSKNDGATKVRITEIERAAGLGWKVRTCTQNYSSLLNYRDATVLQHTCEVMHGTCG